MASQDLSRYRQINPDSVVEFLVDNGWKEIQKRPEVVSLWSTEKQESVYKILLPLNPDLPDYPNRLIDALEVVSEVESKDKLDLLGVLLDGSILAKERERELMDLRLLPDIQTSQAHKFPIKDLGMILYSLQNLIDSIGKAESGYISSSVAGRISNAVTERTKLFVFDTVPGSFVVKMEGCSPAEQRELTDEEYGTLEQRSLKSFLDLIRISHNGELAPIKEILSKLQRRTAITYKKFLKSLSSANSGFDVRLNSNRLDFNGSASLNSSKILRLINLLEDLEPQIPEVISVDGILKLIGGSGDNLNFRIQRISDEKVFYGKIASPISRSDVELTHNRMYRATIEETESINPATNESSKNWLLVDIVYLENAIANDESPDDDNK